MRLIRLTIAMFLFLLVGLLFGIGIANAQAATTYNGVCSPVAVYDTSKLDPPSPDPSGLEYLPGAGQFISSDAEVEEVVNGVTHFEGVNYWIVTLDSMAGDPILLEDVFETTTVAPPNPPGYSDEPVGLAVNPVTKTLYISDDTKDRVYMVEPKADGLYGTSDDRITSFSTQIHGSNDPEGLAVGNGALWIADGFYAEVFKISLDGKTKLAQFDTKYPRGTTVKALSNSEGIGYNPSNGLLYLVGPSQDTTVFEFSQTGVLLRTLDVRGIDNGVNAHNMAGVAIGPATDAPGVNLFISDRFVDNNTDATENDGRIYECRLP